MIILLSFGFFVWLVFFNQYFREFKTEVFDCSKKLICLTRAFKTYVQVKHIRNHSDFVKDLVFDIRFGIWYKAWLSEISVDLEFNLSNS